jgi:hypothetical protein
MLMKELHDYYGNWSKLTRELDLGISTYQGWVKKGYIPYTTQLIIEKKTKGKFKANIAHGKPIK